MITNFYNTVQGDINFLFGCSDNEDEKIDKTRFVFASQRTVCVVTMVLGGVVALSGTAMIASNPLLSLCSIVIGVVSLVAAREIFTILRASDESLEKKGWGQFDELNTGTLGEKIDKTTGYFRKIFQELNKGETPSLFDDYLVKETLFPAFWKYIVRIVRNEK